MNSGAPSQIGIPLRWVSRDAWLIILARALRTFAQASVSVFLAIYLNLLGLSIVQISLFISAGMAGAAFFAFVVVLIGDTLGRRRLLVGFTLFTGAAAMALAFTDQLLLLALVAFLGSFSVAGPGGPVQPLETASLPGTAPEERRTDLFAIYNMVSTGASALGALAAGLPTLFRDVLGLEVLSSYRVMFVGYALIAVLEGGVYALLSPSVEVKAVNSNQRRWSNPLRLPSRRIIFTLAGLSSLDSFGTRLIVQSLVALWFYTKFGVDLKSVAFLFFGSYLVSAVSLWVAAKLANRIGLINTIVFTHIPAVLLIVAMPFLPSAKLAAGIWLVRGFFSLMDVPAKQSYTMSVVAPNERSAMAGINNVGQSIIGAAAPTVAGILWSSLSASVPFVACGAVKSLNLIGLYLMFRKVRPPQEQRRIEAMQGQGAMRG